MIFEAFRTQQKHIRRGDVISRHPRHRLDPLLLFFWLQICKVLGHVFLFLFFFTLGKTGSGKPAGKT